MNQITYVPDRTIYLSVKITELFLLDNIFTGVKKDVLDYFKKKNHTSRTKEYREHSEAYNQELARDIIMSQIPDYDVTEIGELKITDISDYKTIKKYYIMEYTYTQLQSSYYDEMSGYEYDDSEEEVKELFLVENPYHVYGAYDIIGSLDQILKSTEIRHALLEHQKDSMQTAIRERLKDLTDDKVFEVIAPDIFTHLSNFRKVSYYRRFTHETTDYKHAVVVYENHDSREKYPIHIYGEEEVRQVCNDQNDRRKFYDSSDRIVSHSWYDSETYYMFWKKMEELERERAVS